MKYSNDILLLNCKNEHKSEQRVIDIRQDILTVSRRYLDRRFT